MQYTSTIVSAGNWTFGDVYGSYVVKMVRVEVPLISCPLISFSSVLYKEYDDNCEEFRVHMVTESRLSTSSPSALLTFCVVLLYL